MMKTFQQQQHVVWSVVMVMNHHPRTVGSLISRESCFLRNHHDHHHNRVSSQHPWTTSSSRFTSMASRRYQSTTSSSTSDDPLDENFFLHQVETTVQNVLNDYVKKEHDETMDILELTPAKRQAYGIAKHLDQRLKNLRTNQDCPKCWMQRKHCICHDIHPLDTNIPMIHRLFVVVHHKEVGLKVDTAKLIWATFPTQARLVIGGIGSDHQASMKELEQAIQTSQQQQQHDGESTMLVLFPDPHAKTLSEIYHQQQERRNGPPNTNNTTATNNNNNNKGWDVVILDGTWAQARKLQSRHLPEDLQRVQLSSVAVEQLATLDVAKIGHQLRRHDVAWKQVGTFEALRLFLQDLWMLQPIITMQEEEQKLQDIPTLIQPYQEIANRAALRELGPPRISQNKNTS